MCAVKTPDGLHLGGAAEHGGQGLACRAIRFLGGGLAGTHWRETTGTEEFDEEVMDLPVARHAQQTIPASLKLGAAPTPLTCGRIGRHMPTSGMSRHDRGPASHGHGCSRQKRA
jgi:hypothetical protein